MARASFQTELPLDFGTYTDLEALRAAAASCKRCMLWRHATQTVFGEGPPNASLVLVGEQPGDKEDLAGHPFVGPAGAILDKALKDAKIPRAQAYVTNAVKHFKNEPRGKRRLHKRPDPNEIRICSAWLRREIQIIEPKLVVALGATAAYALLSRTITIRDSRQQIFSSPDGFSIVVTNHPSAILRMSDDESRRQAYSHLVEDFVWIRSHGLSKRATRQRAL